MKTQVYNLKKNFESDLTSANNDNYSDTDGSIINSPTTEAEIKLAI